MTIPTEGEADKVLTKIDDIVEGKKEGAANDENKTEEKIEELPEYKTAWKDKLKEKTCCFWMGILGNSCLLTILFLDIYWTFLTTSWFMSLLIQLLNWMVFDIYLILLALGMLILLYIWLSSRSFKFITRNFYACMVIIFLNIFTITLWIIISTSTYSPALFDARLNGGERLKIPEPRVQGGQPFSMLNFMWPKAFDVFSETHDVRNYSEMPRYPKGDFTRPCCGKTEVPTSEWEDTLRLDVVKASVFANSTSLLPVIFHIHGGGYTAGDRTHIGEWLPVLGQGYALVSTSYRFLHYGYLASDMVGDIMDAIEWVISEGKKYSLDPSRILLVGISAGGHLALLSSTFINEEHPGRVKVVINISGPTEIVWMWKNYVEGKIILDAGIISNFMKLANITGFDDPDIEEKLRWLVPSSYLENVNYAIVTVHGIPDLLVDHEMSVLFHDKLDNAGISNYLISMPTTGHGGSILYQYATHILERCAAKYLL